ncbi:MAG: sigma-54-dependent transcriptional regulator [Paracoccaceae bacterium]
MFSGFKVAIIDDEKDIRDSISQWLSLSGYETEVFSDAESALTSITSGYPGIVITDIKMPGMSGMGLLKRLMWLDSTLPIVLITGHGDVAMAVEAMHLGAYDFLEKPFEPDIISQITFRAIKSRQLVLESRALRDEFSGSTNDISKLVGSSDSWEKLKEKIIDVGQSNSHVLIQGETGAGKTLIAHALHSVGSKINKDLLVLSCNMFSSPGVVDEGSFKSLLSDKIAAIESIKTGDLILEDIERLPKKYQGWLLKIIDDRSPNSEFRIISIDNSSTKNSTSNENLRKDLYFRLAGLEILVPPLRQRVEDILTLLNHYLDFFSLEYGLDEIVLSSDDIFKLSKFPWPGNVRQLKSIAERIVLNRRRGIMSISSILIDDNEGLFSHQTEEGRPLKEYVEAFEKTLITSAMKRYNGSISDVMKELQMPRRTLNEKMARYNLQRLDYL